MGRSPPPGPSLGLPADGEAPASGHRTGADESPRARHASRVSRSLPVLPANSAAAGNHGLGDAHVTIELLDPPAPTWRRGDPVALAAALALIAVAAYVGRRLLARGVEIVLPSPPLIAYWDPHLGWGTPLAVGCGLLGLRLQRVAPALSWRRLLLAGWLLNLAWMVSLTLVDGLARGWVAVLLNPNEYLADLPSDHQSGRVPGHLHRLHRRQRDAWTTPGSGPPMWPVTRRWPRWSSGGWPGSD